MDKVEDFTLLRSDAAAEEAAFFVVAWVVVVGRGEGRAVVSLVIVGGWGGAGFDVVVFGDVGLAAGGGGAVGVEFGGFVDFSWVGEWLVT